MRIARTRAVGRFMALATASVVLAATQVAAAYGRVQGASHTPCQRLKGKDLAPHAKVKLVERPNADDGHDLLGCVLPAGTVRHVAGSADYFTSGESYAVRRVARTVVLLDLAADSQYGSSRSTGVYDIRTGRSYGIASSSYPIGDPGPPSNTSAAVALVNKAAQAVAIITRQGGGPSAIAGFSATGERVDLDTGTSEEIPASSLGLHYSTASWTHSGQQRSAALPR